MLFIKEIYFICNIYCTRNNSSSTKKECLTSRFKSRYHPEYKFDSKYKHDTNDNIAVVEYYAPDMFTLTDKIAFMKIFYDETLFDIMMEKYSVDKKLSLEMKTYFLSSNKVYDGDTGTDCSDISDINPSNTYNTTTDDHSLLIGQKIMGTTVMKDYYQRLVSKYEMFNLFKRKYNFSDDFVLFQEKYIGNPCVEKLAVVINEQCHLTQIVFFMELKQTVISKFIHKLRVIFYKYKYMLLADNRDITNNCKIISYFNDILRKLKASIIICKIFCSKKNNEKYILDLDHMFHFIFCRMTKLKTSLNYIFENVYLDKNTISSYENIIKYVDASLNEILLYKSRFKVKYTTILSELKDSKKFSFNNTNGSESLFDLSIIKILFNTLDNVKSWIKPFVTKKNKLNTLLNRQQLYDLKCELLDIQEALNMIEANYFDFLKKDKINENIFIPLVDLDFTLSFVYMIVSNDFNFYGTKDILYLDRYIKNYINGINRLKGYMCKIHEMKDLLEEMNKMTMIIESIWNEYKNIINVYEIMGILLNMEGYMEGCDGLKDILMSVRFYIVNNLKMEIE